MKNPLRLVKYVIGLLLALLAVSNCFSVLSSSSSSTVFTVDDASSIEQAKQDQHNPSLASLAGANRGQSLLQSNRGGAVVARAGLMTSAASAVSFVTSPFAPAITATKSHMLPPGDTQADPGDTLTYTIVITNSGTSDATGVNFTDTIDPNTTLVPGSVIASPIAVDDSYQTIGNVNIQVPMGQGLIANDSNPNGAGTLTVTKVNSTNVPGGGSATTSTSNGSVTMSSDGSFSYTPNVSFRGPSDSFTYTLGNGTGKTDTATVTIAVNGLIWFVNVAAAPGGDGRLSTPFNCLVGPGCFDPVAADAANDNIFLYSGVYTGGLTLLSGQKLIGQGASQPLLTITGLTAPSGDNLLPSTGGANPTITSSVNGINLGSNNQIWGVTFGSKTGAGISGSGFGTLTVRDTAINGTGQALNLSTGTLDAIFQSISSTTSSSTGMTVNAAAGSMSVTGTTSIINVSGVGVNLTNNTGTISFGALDITNANQKGLLATDNSNTITTTSGTISTTGAAAVEITKTSGTTPLNITLTSVSANGGNDGIFLSNTSGSFTVNGDGSNTTVGGNSTGGTIQNTIGADGSTSGIGVYLNNATNITLRRMSIHDHQGWGIRGVTVTGFTLEYTTINGSNGTNDAFAEGSVYFTGLTGSAAVTSCIISGGWRDNFRILNTSGTLNRLTMSNTTIGLNSTNFGNNGVSLEASGASTTLNATVTSCTFTGTRADYLVGDDQSGATMDLVFTSNNFSNSHTNSAPAGQRMRIAGNGPCTYKISNNTIRDSSGSAIFVNSANSQGNLNGRIEGNTVGVQGVANSGSTAASGIDVESNGGGDHVALINNNIVQQYNNNGILLLAGDQMGNPVTFQITVTNNTVRNPGTLNTNFNGIQLNNGIVGTDNFTSCVDIKTNTVAGSGTGATDIRLRQRQATTVRLPGYGGANNDNTAVQNFVSGQQTTITTITASNTVPTGGGYIGGGACTQTSVMSLGPEVTASSVRVSDGANSAGNDDEERSERDGTLLAARGEGDNADIQKLRQEELIWLAQAAVQRWREAGISDEDVTRIQAVTFELADLPDGQIATASGTGIRVDETGAGYGWFFDQTPGNELEFDVPVPGGELQTTEFSAAFNRMDLLTVLVRQLGYVYLQGKDRVPKQLRPLMQPTLSPSVRRMPVFNIPDRSTSRRSPGAGQSVDGKAASTPPSQPKVDSSISLLQLRPAVFNPSTDLMPGSYERSARRMSHAASARRGVAFNPAPFSGETVTLNIGTIPPGESVTIMFQVTINNPLPPGVCSVTNQGHVTGTNFSQVDTNNDVTPIAKPVTIGACPANITTNTDPGVCTAVVTYTTPTGDGCPTPTVTCNPPSGFAFPKGTTTVTCTATNGNPPDASCTFTVTVNDNQPPTITCPANVTQGTDPGLCSAVVTYSNATASDNCPGVGTPVCAPASGTTFAKGTTTVNCTVSDASGNSANCSFTVTVNDTTPPTITCPSNVTQSTDPNQCSAVVTYPNATATDNCPGVGTPVCTPASGSSFAKGTTTVNCTVSDASGNPATCSFTVMVNDTQPPAITCPANVTQSTDPNQCSAVVNYPNATATDNCSGVGTPVCTPASGSTFAKGTTTVNCTVSDASGNPASCSFTVTVNDTQVPSITCPSTVTQNTDPNQCSAVVTYSNATATDNCSGVGTPVCTPASGTTFAKGTTTVNCTVSDSSGNSTSCSFTVTVVDNQSPTIGACPAPITTNTASGQCSAVVNYATPSASDNCPGVIAGCSPPSGTAFPKGTITVTCTATDTSNHTASCSFTVTVIDNQPPSITCPGNINRDEDSPGSGCATVTYTTPTPSDNCPGATANCLPPSGTCFPVGTTTVTCTATDTSGNTSSCQFTVTVTPIGLTSLSPAKVWIGLKNSDDVGTKFDLLAEVLRNGSVVGSGQLNDVPGGSSGFNNAVLRTITLALSSAVPMGPGDTMSFRLSVRIGATSAHNTGTARLWYNGAAIDSGASRDAGSRFDATIRGTTSDYFLRSPGFTLDTTAGSSRTFVDKLVSNSGGNPFVAFGTWSKTF